MSTLTTDQRTDMQGDLGITTDQTVFTNDELDRLYTRADSDYNLAVYMGYRQLLADSAKFFKYTAGHTEMNKQQVFEHVKAMVDFWKEEARTAGNQLKILGLTEIPPRIKDDPDVPVKRIRNWNVGIL